jgi:phosphoribosyl-AMP cyclohydrolase
VAEPATHEAGPEIGRLDFSKGDGLIPVIVQDSATLAVLMLGYANREALEKTLDTGLLHFWSRSRSEIWLKGERSGNYLRVARLALDCDQDALLAVVTAETGETPICHTGAETCFFSKVVSSKFF